MAQLGFKERIENGPNKDKDYEAALRNLNAIDPGEVRKVGTGTTVHDERFG